jgi:hypothetical protein
MPYSDTAVAYALTRVPLHAGMLAALLVGVFVAWSSRYAEMPRPHESLLRRTVAAGLPFVVLVALLFVALGRTWSQFDDLEVAVGEEAGAALALGRLAAVLPEEPRARVRAHVRAYVHEVADEEFPAMARGESPPTSSAHLEAVAAVWTGAGAAPEFVAEALRSVDAIHAGRARRSAAVVPSVPPRAFLLGLLALVASVRMASAALVGPPALRAVVTSLVVFTTLAAALLVAQFALPFAGDLSVDADPFVDAANALAERPGR